MEAIAEVLPGSGLMRVGVDARALNCPHLRGMGKYLAQIVARIARRGETQFELLCDRPDWPLHAPTEQGVHTHIFEMRGDRFRVWEQFAMPRRASQLGIDVLHCPAGTAPLWQPCPTVLTLHDAIPWNSDAEDWKRGWYVDHLLPRAFQRVAAVITDSESSCRDIASLFPALKAKTHVIPLGVDDSYLHFRPAPLSDDHLANGIRQPYLLYLGGTVERKRFNWAAKVLDELGMPHLQLVACGIDSASREGMFSRIPSTVRNQVVFAPFLDEATMPNLYANAAAVLYPTLYEGFGLPALEAQAVGVPVLFSDVGSLGELKGPGAVVLPTEDLSAWVDACRSVVNERSEHSRPDELARKWAGQFSWDACAEKTLNVYKSVACRGLPHGRDISVRCSTFI